MSRWLSATRPAQRTGSRPHRRRNRYPAWRLRRSLPLRRLLRSLDDGPPRKHRGASCLVVDDSVRAGPARERPRFPRRDVGASATAALPLKLDSSSARRWRHSRKAAPRSPLRTSPAPRTARRPPRKGRLARSAAGKPRPRSSSPALSEVPRDARSRPHRPHRAFRHRLLPLQPARLNKSFFSASPGSPRGVRRRRHGKRSPGPSSVGLRLQSRV